MKKALCYLSFALALGIAGLAFQQCSEPQEKPTPVETITTTEAAQALLDPYVTVEDLAYKLNISEEDAAKLGVSPSGYRHFAATLNSINEAVQEQLAEDPDAIISLYDPKDERIHIHEGDVCSRSGESECSGQITVGESKTITWKKHDIGKELKADFNFNDKFVAHKVSYSIAGLGSRTDYFYGTNGTIRIPLTAHLQTSVTFTVKGIYEERYYYTDYVKIKYFPYCAIEWGAYNGFVCDDPQSCTGFPDCGSYPYSWWRSSTYNIDEPGVTVSYSWEECDYVCPGCGCSCLSKCCGCVCSVMETGSGQSGCKCKITERDSCSC